MRSILLIFVSGCCLGCGDSSELASLKSSLRITGEEVVAKQDESIAILRENTTALAAIKSQVESLATETREATGTLKASLVKSEPQREEVIKSALEPQEAERKESHTSQLAASPPAVRLFVTHAPFYCQPCERLKDAVEAGDFDGFAVEDSGEFAGLRSYPAIRFETPTTATGWGVVYGFDKTTVPTLRALTQEGKTSQPVGAIFPLQTANTVTSSRTSFRSVSRWQGHNRGQRVTTRTTCRSGACP